MPGEVVLDIAGVGAADGSSYASPSYASSISSGAITGTGLRFLRVTEIARPRTGAPCEDEDEFSEGRRGRPTVVNGSALAPTSWAEELESCMEELKAVGGEDDADEPGEGVLATGTRCSAPSRFWAAASPCGDEVGG